MITPLGQRQILTTAALEAVRLSQDGTVQGQLLIARRQATLEKMTEAHEEVPQVAGSEELRLEPDHQQGNQGGEEGSGAWGKEVPDGESAPEAAGSAEGHLDFLA